MKKFNKKSVSLLCKGSLITSFGVLVGACTHMSTELPTDVVPDSFQGPQYENATVWPERDWWSNFNQPELDWLIGQVETNNLDLVRNRNNLLSAQIVLKQAGFDLWPTPQISIGNSSSVSGIGSGDTNSNNQFSLNASVSYNNILSKYSNNEASLLSYESSAASAVDTHLNTLGTAASTYFQLLYIRDQKVAAQQNLENAEAIARITQAKVDAGVTTAIDALQQQIAVQRQRNSLQNLDQSELSTRASLALLIGRSVQDFDLQGQTLENIMVPEVQPGLPSELLLRRPDLVQAEANLRSAEVSVDLARLNFLPSISLNASSNTVDSSLADILKNPNPISISASLVETLLDNGTRKRNVERSRLNLETSLASYRKTVLQAFNDIEVSLGNIALLEAQTATAQQDLERAEEAFRIAQVQYREGVSNYQTLLTAQNTLYSSRNTYLQNKLSRLNAVVSFYQSLGGGWQKGDEPNLHITEAN